MPAVTKSPNQFGVLLKTEASYNAGGSPTGADDGLLVMEPPVVDVEWAHDGSRGQSPGSGANLRRSGKSGRTGSVALVTDFIGPEVAYSATELPSNHVALLISGHSANIDTTVDAEQVTYTPVSKAGDWDSGVLECYYHGEKAILQGALADFEIVSEDGGAPVWTFNAQGLLPTLEDAAVPSITYPTALPPKAKGITLNIGSYGSAVVRSFTFRRNQSIGSRTDQNASGGHAGFGPGNRTVELEVELEKPARVADPFHSASGADFRALEEAGTLIAADLTVGSEQYNKFKISGANVQVVEVDDSDDDASALYTVTFEFFGSNPGADDEYTIEAL